MAVFELILFCMFFDSDLKIRAEALEIIEYILGIKTVIAKNGPNKGKEMKKIPPKRARKTVRKLNHIAQAKYLDFHAPHYSKLMGKYRDLPKSFLTIPPPLLDKDYNVLSDHAKGIKEIVLPKITQNGIEIEKQVKWTTMSCAKGKQIRSTHSRNFKNLYKYQGRVGEGSGKGQGRVREGSGKGQGRGSEGSF